MGGLISGARSSAIGRGVSRFAQAQGPRWATVIGWQALTAFFPILLAGITVLSLAAGDASGGLQDHIVGIFPKGEDQSGIRAGLGAVRHAGGVLAIVGLLGLLWGGSGLFGAIDQGLDALYPTPPRSFLPQKLMSTGMVLVFSLLLLPVVASSSLLPALGSLPDVPPFLTNGPVALLLQIGIGVVLGTGLFAVIFYVVPNRHVGLRTALPGALLSGVLFEVLTLVFPVYFSLSHGFTHYGQTFALFFLLMNFFYLFGIITMLGGAFNAARDPAAQPLPDEHRRLGSGLAQPEQPARQPGEARGEAGEAPPDGGEGRGRRGKGHGRRVWTLTPPRRRAVEALARDLPDPAPAGSGGGDRMHRNRGIVMLGAAAAAGFLRARRPH